MNTVYDLIVCGGSIAGCITAIAAAKKGYSVVLVENKTYLGDSAVSGMMTGCDEENNAALKYRLLQSVELCGVEVLFMSELTAVALMQEYAVGALVSNRFGQQLIYARAVIDASDFDRCVEMADNINTWSYRGRCGFCLKCTGENPPSPGEYELPENMGISENKLYVRKSFDGDIFAYFMFDAESSVSRYADLSEWNRKAAGLSSEIIASLDIFENLRIIQASHEICLVDSGRKISSSKKYKNIVSVCFPFNPYRGFSESDIDECGKIAASILDELSFWDRGGEAEEIRSRSIVIPCSECIFEDYDDHKMPVDCKKVSYDYGRFLPDLDTADILVAGGGTAGTAAAIAAAGESDNVVIADENPGFGGTQTFGSVCRYYHGYVKGFSLLQEQRIPKSSPVYKRFSYGQQLAECNVRQYTGITMFGAVCTSNEIQGVAAANADIWGIIRARVTVDATGNADIADFCGISTRIGALRDGNLQDYSQSVIERSGLDLDVINHCSYSELLRGIKLAHTQYELGDFSVMLTPRAARCFEGDYRITMEDILLEKRYDDCIAIASTDSDAHGAMSSVIHYMGFVPYHDRIFTLEIPYRACIPKSFNRLLVAGKSLSATPDAAGYFRMAADVINRGYAIGLAAAMSDGTDVRKIDYAKLKQKLVEAEILPKVQPESRSDSGDEAKLLNALCSYGAKDIEKLKNEYAISKSDSSAIALAWHGIGDGAEQLIDRLGELLDKEKDVHYSDTHPFKPGNNKGGVMGEVELYWQINRIITVLAMLKEPGCRELICRALKSFDGGGSYVRNDNDYIYGRIDLQRIPHFDRIRVLCFYIEQCPDTAYIEPLMEILSEKGMGGFVTGENIIGRNYQNAYIELTILRTLARCGSCYGIKMLAEYLEDVHYILSKHAHDELVEIVGVDLGYDREVWNNMFENNYDCRLTPYIYTDSLF